MTIPGIDKPMIKEMTIVVLQATDGTYYAQSAALSSGKTKEQAVRRCMRCMSDPELARRYDMYRNGEIDLASAERRPVNEDLRRCL